MNEIVIVLLVAFSTIGTPAVAANEPFSVTPSVEKTANGRIILRAGPSARVQAQTCIAQAKSLIDELLPHAEAVAKAKLEVTPPEIAATGEIGQTEEAVARWRGGKPGHGSISIFTDFCRLAPAAQRATIAHELGHGIDGIVRPAPTPCIGYGCRAANAVAAALDDSARPWESRQGEIAATAWAVEIYRHAGLLEDELKTHFSRHSQEYWAASQSYLKAQ